MQRAAIISVDGHVKARRSDYRDYIEKKYLAEFDEQVKAQEEQGVPDGGNIHPQFGPDPQWDSDLRLSTLEAEGVVAEVLFPNGVPFQLNPFDDYAKSVNPEVAAAGRRAYNRWLIDFCSLVPGRRAGQMLVAFDDVEQAVKDVYWAKENGLSGIMLPAVEPNKLYMFDPALDPIWAAVQDVGLPLSQHGGAGIEAYTPPGFAMIMTLAVENAFFANRSLWQMIAGGVFDRFPGLRCAWIETQVFFMQAAITQLDLLLGFGDSWMDWAAFMGRERSVQRKASEYFGTNVFVGVSPFTSMQVGMAELTGKTADGELPGFHIGPDAAMFGADFPHFETIVPNTKAEASTLATAPGVSEADTRKVLLENAAELYGFDLAVLQPHIDRVGFDTNDDHPRTEPFAFLKESVSA